MKGSCQAWLMTSMHQSTHQTRIWSRTLKRVKLIYLVVPATDLIRLAISVTHQIHTFFNKRSITTMALIQLIYTSRLIDNGPEVIAAILQTSRRTNKLHNITGMLLCANSGVLQVLEGEDACVSELYRSIELDKRHNEIFLLSKTEVTKRQFACWDMGFRRLSETEISNSAMAAEVFNADRDEISNRVAPGPALAMLVLFGQGIEVVQ